MKGLVGEMKYEKGRCEGRRDVCARKGSVKALKIRGRKGCEEKAVM